MNKAMEDSVTPFHYFERGVLGSIRREEMQSLVKPKAEPTFASNAGNPTPAGPEWSAKG